MKKISTSFVRGENCNTGFYGELRNFDIAVKNTDDDTAAKIIDAIVDQINDMIKDEWDTGSAWRCGCPATLDQTGGREYSDIISIEIDEDESVSRQIEDIKRFYKIAKKNVLAQYN